MTSSPNPPTHSHWPSFFLAGPPEELARYVVPDVVAQHAAVPAGSGEASLARLGKVWDVLHAAEIGYAHERPEPPAPAGEQPTADEADPRPPTEADTEATASAVTVAGLLDPAGPGRAQYIRPPAELLRAPKAGTCLDLAVLLAGACVHAGLPAAIVIVDPPAGGSAAHALVAVTVRGDWPAGPPAGGVWTAPPDRLADAVRTSLDGPPRDVVVVDPVGLARSLGTTRTAGTDVPLAAAVQAGYRYLTDGDWTWRYAVLAGRRPDAYQPAPLPDVLPLRAIYREPETAESPLRLLRAEYQVTPFQARDELTVLRDFADQVVGGDRTGLAVVHGAGGAGKTRLALELLQRLWVEGWYAGPLLDDLHDPASVSWLVNVTAPLAVLVDYADARTAETRALLQTLTGRPGPPALVILTARSTEGDWLKEIVGNQTAAAPYRPEEIELPDSHPRPGDVYRRTHQALRDDGLPAPALPPPGPGWRRTTLDLVLLGWIAAHTDALPASREALYGEVLDHEQRYWTRSYQRITGRPTINQDILAAAAACLTLLTPDAAGAADVLRAVPELGEDGRWRDDVARTLRTCLDPGPGQHLAIRPDPIGDHHLLTTLGRDPQLLQRALPPGADTGRLLAALLVLTRSGGDQPTGPAASHIAALIRAEPARWPVALAIATALDGPTAAALETLTAATDCPLPLDELSAAIPHQATGLWRLGQLVDERRLATSPPSETEQRAGLLLEVSARRAAAGDHPAALAAIDEAVTAYRRLAEANPAAYLPDVAMSLNNQSNRRSELGDRAGALAAIDEAVTIRRRLAKANPAAYLPNLARALGQSGRLRRDMKAPDHAAAIWNAALDDQILPIYRGELQAHRAAWESENNDRGSAVATLHEALTLVSADPDNLPAFAVSRARQTAREVALTFDPPDTAAFPRWATASIPDDDLAFINNWAGATSWTERETAIQNYGQAFPGPTLADTVDTLDFLYPGEPTFEAVRALLTAVHEHGLPAVLDQARATDRLQTQVHEWIATPTWPESFTYLADHYEQLHTEDVAAFLDYLDQPVAQQHLAILMLSSGIPPEAVFEIVTDPAAATDRALDALEHGQADHLRLILRANPAVLELPSTGPLLLAVLALAADDIDNAKQAAMAAGSTSSPIQRRAHLVRLRALASHTADLPSGPAGVAALITAFETTPKNETPTDTHRSDQAPAEDHPDNADSNK